MAETGPLFCALAWGHRFTNVNGEVQVCCTSEERDNRILRDTGEPFRVRDGATDEEILNSKFMKETRLRMLAGAWPSFCERCRVTEASGGTSRRQEENLKESADISERLRTTAPDGSIPVRVTSVDYRLSNLCNLACVMCNPRSSSRWISDWPKVDQTRWVLTDREKTLLASYDWSRAPEVLGSFKRQLSNLKRLHFAGGEPLLIPEMQDFLRACIEAGVSGNIELTYNTNLTRIPEALKELWPRFRGVKLHCSVDATGPLNDLIRHPSHWETIDRNLRDLDHNHARYGVTEVLVTCTVQVYSVFSLKRLYDYLAEGFEFVTRVPHLVDLHLPEYFNTQVLPRDLKVRALEELKAADRRTRERIARGQIPADQEKHLASLLGSMNHLLSGEMQGWLGPLVRVIDSTDALRGQDSYALVPELGLLKARIKEGAA